MIQAKHCDLCEYPKRSLKIGLTCGLTDRKPNFKVTCSNIKFSNSFKEYIPELLNQIEEVKKNKTSVYFHFFLLTGIGIVIIFGSYSLLKQTSEMEFGGLSIAYFENSILVYMLGALFLSMAFLNYIKHKRKSKKLILEKDKIEKVLRQYGIDFETIMK
jgi:hypothetical protein